MQQYPWNYRHFYSKMKIKNHNNFGHQTKPCMGAWKMKSGKNWKNHKPYSLNSLQRSLMLMIIFLILNILTMLIILNTPGTRPTKDISIEFGIRSKFGVLWFKMCLSRPQQGSSVGNSHRSASLRPTTLEEDRELFVNFSLILCLWFEIQDLRAYNFFDWISNTAGVYTKFSGRLSEEPVPWLIRKFLCILIFKSGQQRFQLNLSERQIRLDLTSRWPLV